MFNEEYYSNFVVWLQNTPSNGKEREKRSMNFPNDSFFFKIDKQEGSR